MAARTSTAPRKRAPAKRAKPVPRLNPAERAERNSKVLGLFIAGLSQREIARQVGSDAGSVNRIIKAELAHVGRHRELLADYALTVYITRLEQMINAAWPAALEGDLKAIETVCKLLVEEAKLYGIVEGGAVVIPPTAPIPEEDVEEEIDELAAWRAQRPTGGVARRIPYSDEIGGLTAEERDKLIVKLRAAGSSVREIGREVGMDHGTVRRALERIAQGRPGRVRSS